MNQPSMPDRMYTWLAKLCVLLISSWLLVTWDTHRGAERPLQSIVLIMFFCGAILLLCSRFSVVTDAIGEDNRRRSSQVIPNGDGGLDKSPLRNLDTKLLSWRQPFGRQTRQQLLKAIVTSLVLRAGTLWLMSRDIQCSSKAVEFTLLPCLVLIHEIVTGQRPRSDNCDSDDISRTIYAVLYHNFTHSLVLYLIPAILLCFGVYQISSQSLPSTYICSRVIGAPLFVLTIQVVGTVLDFLIILGTRQLLDENADNKAKFVTLGVVSILPAIILVFLGTAISLWNWGGIGFMFHLSTAYLWSIIKDSAACTVLILCAIHIKPQTGLLQIIFSIMCCSVSSPVLFSAWSSRSPFPPNSNSAKVTGLFAVFAAFLLSTRLYATGKSFGKPSTFTKCLSAVMMLIIIVLFIVSEVFLLIRSNNIGSHPIYNLMYKARIEGDRWLVKASESQSLNAAVLEYRDRHLGRDPPPNFDKWYAYAVQKGSPIIDNYESIDRDLLPFWGMEPAETRLLTLQSLQPASNLDGFVSIKIRDGKATSGGVSDGVRMDVIKIFAMINEFAQWLPDLEIAVNLRRQPRVALPWGKIIAARTRGTRTMKQKKPGTKNVGFSKLADDELLSKLGKSKTTKSKQNEHIIPFMPSAFDESVSPSCPPFSRARQSRSWNPQDICAKCAAPHSDGPFIKNWTIAADLCHQPDMANMHGFFTGDGLVNPGGPPKKTLLAIFSRSKVTGFNDILFPFPGDYIDAETPDLSDMDFHEKENKLFWRGALSTEGASFDHQWQGMQQPRLVHLTNNYNSSKITPILVPSTKENKFTYEKVPASELNPLLSNLDVGFTNNMPCMNLADCHVQVREFGTRKAVDFSEHNNYRYLFSLDKYGGSSTDLIPFLRSRSAPFHMSIFRSWYDDRLVPWLHFVPQDGRLHELHSTLAYFMGFKGRLNGREVEMEGRPEQAAFIADQGRKWALKALRRDDASVYAFRLLLEYARVVDDRRDEIGYVGESISTPD